MSRFRRFLIFHLFLYSVRFSFQGTGEFINTKFFCRVCAMLHDPQLGLRAEKDAHYADINDWWRGPGTCINGSWRKFEQAAEGNEKNRKVTH